MSGNGKLSVTGDALALTVTGTCLSGEVSEEEIDGALNGSASDPSARLGVAAGHRRPRLVAGSPTDHQIG